MKGKKEKSHREAKGGKIIFYFPSAGVIKLLLVKQGLKSCGSCLGIQMLS